MKQKSSQGVKQRMKQEITLFLQYKWSSTSEIFGTRKLLKRMSFVVCVSGSGSLLAKEVKRRR